MKKPISHWNFVWKEIELYRSGPDFIKVLSIVAHNKQRLTNTCTSRVYRILCIYYNTHFNLSIWTFCTSMSSPKPSSSWICQACISWTPGQETHVIWNGSPPDLVCSHPESLGYVEGLSFTNRQKYAKNRQILPHLGLLLHHSVALLQRRLQRKEFESPFLVKLSSWFWSRYVWHRKVTSYKSYQLSPVPSLSEPRHHKTSLTWKGL